MAGELPDSERLIREVESLRRRVAELESESLDVTRTLAETEARLKEGEDDSRVLTATIPEMVSRQALRASEALFRSLVQCSPDHMFFLDLDGRFVTSNGRPEDLGLPTDVLIIGRLLEEVYLPDISQAYRGHFQRVVETHLPVCFEHRLGLDVNDRVHQDTLFPILADGQLTGIGGIGQDITERKRTEEALRLSFEVLDAANQQDSLSELLAEFVSIIQRYAGCAAVGIRLLDKEGNIPYRGHTGFSQEFYSRESPLSVMRDQCMCINVVLGKTDSSLPYFTPKGSFRMGATTRFLATVSSQEKGPTRNVCNEMGYESVALVPIKKGEAIIGLIHLADPRENMMPLGMVEVMEDVAIPMGTAIQRVLVETRLKESLAEKEVLLREVHHRVKNNLAAIVGLLDLERRVIGDATITTSLMDLSSRIQAMALVHERLYRSENLSRIDFQGYLKALISHLRTSLSSRRDLHYTIAAAGIQLGVDIAVPCGMIVSELVTNAIKHAFPSGRPHPGASRCEVDVSMEWDGAAYTLTVADNGVGLPAELDWATAKSLGLRLVRTLGQHQLGGRIEVDRAGGTRFVLTFGSGQGA